MQNPTDYQWITTAIGWTLLHSLWQITLIGIAWWLITLKAFKKRDLKISTATRYFYAILAMVLIVMVSVFTLASQLKIHYPIQAQIQTEGINTQATVFPKTIAASGMANKLTAVPNPNIAVPIIDNAPVEDWLSPAILKTLAILWACGVFFFGIRFVLQWIGMRRLAYRGTIPFEAKHLAIFNQLKSKIGIQKGITFLQSSRIASPMTFGHLKPVILLPLGMINGFPPEQIEAILLHELAHIRRHDFLINAVQTWLEILFFYHPVVWIISKKIRTLREELCDDEVLRVMSDADHKKEVNHIYAESLLNVQKYFLHNKNQLVMNAKGNKSELSHRIHRLFQPNQTLTKKKTNLNAYLFGLVMLIALGSYAFKSISHPTASIAVDKMNVLYVGIDNPITVAVAGIPIERTKVESEDLLLTNQGNGHYLVNAKMPGIAKIKVTPDGHATQEIEFRVKSINDPVAMLSNSSGGKMDVETLKKTEGVDAVVQCFEYDAPCEIKSYNMTWVGKNEDPVESINRSATYNENTKELIEKAKVGDIFYIDNVKCQCPGDAEERKINSMVFKIN